VKNISAFLAGIVFALGLAISKMTDPKRVIAFLQWGPNWSESLLFVMGGALSVSLLGTWWALRRPRPILDYEFHLPQKAHIDRTLLSGAILFGIGWGLSGYCPGPLVTGLASLHSIPWIIFIAFLFGHWLARKLRP
jgi:uncharacterized protein